MCGYSLARTAHSNETIILQAYAKLVGKNKTWYIEKPRFILGRKAKKPPKLQPNEQYVWISEEKNISRMHTYVTWDPSKKGWILKCKGKNGLLVNGQTVTPATEEMLVPDRAQLRIGDVTLYFLLPKKA